MCSILSYCFNEGEQVKFVVSNRLIPPLIKNESLQKAICKKAERGLDEKHTPAFHSLLLQYLHNCSKHLDQGSY